MTPQSTLKPEPKDEPNLISRADAWLDERTGIDSILHETLDEPIPGGANWAYIFGSGLLFLFVSQVITGYSSPSTMCRQPTMPTPSSPTSSRR